MVFLFVYSGLCAGVKCQLHAHCEVRDGKAQCLCKDARQCPQTYAPVCGHDNNTYVNKCFLDVANCLVNDTVDNQTPGTCGKSDYCFIDFLEEKNCRS